MFFTDSCTLCPRACAIDRSTQPGYCGMTSTVRIGRADLHLWEEPPISGTRGSGAIFFSGCSLRCVFCQNRVISHGGGGRALTAKELAERMLDLQSRGAHNLNLVTGTQFLPAILSALRAIRSELHIPVVWNTGGYETPETIDALSEFVSVWLPDFKYSSPALASRLSGAADYPTVAAAAIKRMYEHAGTFETDENGIAQRGVIVRHLILPGQRKDSCAVLDLLAEALPIADIRLSLMWQYTPEFLPEPREDGDPYAPLRRRVTTFEYDSVRRHAVSLGFTGYEQDRSAATKDYTPLFDLR